MGLISSKSIGEKKKNCVLEISGSFFSEGACLPAPLNILIAEGNRLVGLIAEPHFLELASSSLEDLAEEVEPGVGYDAARVLILPAISGKYE